MRSPEHEELLIKLMHLVDLDDNGTIDQYELSYNAEATNLMHGYFNEVQKNFLTRADIVELIPELKELSDLIKKLELCLSNEEYDPLLVNKKKLSSVTFSLFCSFIAFFTYCINNGQKSIRYQIREYYSNILVSKVYLPNFECIYDLPIF